MRVWLQRLKTGAGKKWCAARADRLVRIKSNGYYWRNNRCGYTSSRSDAGVYTFADALDASAHCGPEKWVQYEFVGADEQVVPTQESAGPAKLLLRPLVA